MNLAEASRRIERLEEELDNLKKTVASIDHMLLEQANQRIRATGARPQA